MKEEAKRTPEGEVTAIVDRPQPTDSRSDYRHCQIRKCYNVKKPLSESGLLNDANAHSVQFRFKRDLVGQ